MIQPIRTLHRRIFCMAAVITPTIFFAGLGSRQPQLPPERPYTAVQDGFVKWKSGLLATKSTSDSLTVQVLRPLPIPDPLLFCTLETNVASSLPENAVLLGPVRDGAVLRPCKKAQLVLYSLGHREVVDQILLETGR